MGYDRLELLSLTDSKSPVTFELVRSDRLEVLSITDLRSSLYLLEVRSDRLEVIWSAEHGQQDRVGHEVEPWEGPPLVVQVLHQRLEADL